MGVPLYRSGSAVGIARLMSRAGELEAWRTEHGTRIVIKGFEFSVVQGELLIDDLSIPVRGEPRTVFVRIPDGPYRVCQPVGRRPSTKSQQENGSR